MRSAVRTAGHHSNFLGAPQSGLAVRMLDSESPRIYRPDFQDAENLRIAQFENAESSLQ